MKYLLLFWAVVSAIVGLFGWSKFSDLDVLVQNQVRLQLPKEKQAFADYQAQVEKAAELSARYSALAERFEQSDAALRRAEQVGKAFDIEGDLQRLLVESTARERNTDLESFSEQKEVDYTGTLLEPKWRKEVIATLRLFKDSLQERSYPADLIFNATQVCRRLDQSSLAEQLTEEAFKKDPSPPILALYYSSRVSALTGSERDEAFAKLMSLVATLPDNSPQIVLAEGWNAAETGRRYEEFISALDARLARGDAVPSYLYVLKAQALMRSSKPGATDAAQAALELAATALTRETTKSQWFSDSRRELAETFADLQSSRALAATNPDLGP